jgi:hypothetical protein
MNPVRIDAFQVWAMGSTTRKSGHSAYIRMTTRDQIGHSATELQYKRVTVAGEQLDTHHRPAKNATSPGTR